jgi:threonine dehydratase
MNIRNIVQNHSQKLYKIVKKTPMEYNDRLSKIYNANIYLKREDLQFTRSFKIRGAYMKILNSEINSNNSVVCSSAGNHAQSIAYLSNKLNFKSDIFLPCTTQQQKINRIKYFSNYDLCNIHFAGTVFDECLEESKIFAEKHDSIYIHPFDDLDIIAGQGSIGLEIEGEDEHVDIVIATIGGGGLISGISGYLKNGPNNNCKIYGVESENNDSMQKSIKNNKIIKLSNNDFFVDGSVVKQPGIQTFEYCKKYVDEFFTISNNRVCYDLIDLYQNDGIVAELSGAMPISLLPSIADEIKGKNVCCVISGGNNDVLRLKEIYGRKLIYENKLNYYVIGFTQRPGELKKFIYNIIKENDDIILFEYLKKNNKECGNVLIGVHTDNADKIDDRLKNNNYNFTKLQNNDNLFNYLI